MSRRRIALGLGLALVVSLLQGPVAATDVAEPVTKTDNVTPVKHIPYIGGGEVDSDGERYLYAGQANLNASLQRQNVAANQQGGLRIIDLKGEVDPLTGETVGQFEQVSYLRCPGNDNYVRYLNPDVYNTPEGDREFVVMAHHGNQCSKSGAFGLAGDPHTAGSYGAFNGVMVIDVTDKTAPAVVSSIGHYSAHTVKAHPTRPYIYILPGGTTNGTTAGQRISPTGIVDLTDPLKPRYVKAFENGVAGCHDLGFSHDGNYAFCAGLHEIQTWDITGSKIESPEVIGRTDNPAIMFAHNVVVSPDGKYMAINDEAFGFHTCTGEAADLYGSLWIYDITDPAVPLLAGRISPPGHPKGQTNIGAYTDAGPVNGWADSWCAAHNYNWVPGTDIIVTSWFAGGVTAHDISDPMAPEMIARYMPDDGVAWSGHYYAGYMVTNDMVRGTEILDVPELRAAEEAAKANPPAAGTNTSTLGLATPRRDYSDVLIPKVLPPRPDSTTVRTHGEGSICVLPAPPARG